MSDPCPCRGPLDLVANTWSALIIGVLEPGPRRFGELRRTMRGVTPEVRSATLRRLEQALRVTPTVLPEVPLPRLPAAGGGYPVITDGDVVGGLGISGGTHEQDEQVAEVALRVLGSSV